MMIGNRKAEGRECTILLQVIRKSLTHSENRLTASLNRKKPKSDPGFKPSLPRQNAIALPLVPHHFLGPKLTWGLLLASLIVQLDTTIQSYNLEIGNPTERRGLIEFE